MNLRRSVTKGGRFRKQQPQEYIHSDEYDHTANKLFDKETFRGVTEMLNYDNRIDETTPIIFIIKNIKQFSPNVLNDLIHLLRKYREEQTRNFCLVLGVQNNNKDDVHLRINIRNCTKLTMKTFYFPSMKNIIFQVINKMLLSKEQHLTFD